MIKEIAEEMIVQDKRSTSYVLFIVVEDKKVYGMDSAYAQDRERDDRDNIDHEWLCKSCQSLEYNDEEIPDDCDDCDDDCFVHYRIEKDVPNLYAAFFFTAKACNEHIERNRHHYNSTAHSYGISAYHNNELKEIMTHLVGEENINLFK